MGLLSATTTALTGMQAAESIVDVVGNNVANSNTVGFKQSSVIFATQFLQTQSIGSAPSTNLGGTNPRQIGLGVKVASITPSFSQGTIEISASPLDVAIQGDGFFVVKGAQDQQLYTRNGQFKINQKNEIVTSTGQRLMGYGVDDNRNLKTTLEPITIPLGGDPVKAATKNVELKGILNPEVNPGITAAIVTSQVLGNGAIGRPAAPTGAAFDGNDLVRSLQPTVATLAEGTSGTGPAAGAYKYKIVFLDPQGNIGAPSDAFSITTTGGFPVTISSLPAADGTDFIRRAIYRTDAGGSTYKLLTTIPDASTTTSYTDTTASPGSGAVLTDTALEEGNYSYYVTYYNSSNESRPSVQSGSVSVAADSRIRVNLDDLDPPSGGPWTGVRVYRNAAGSSSPHFRVATISLATLATNPAFIDNIPSSAFTTSPTTHPELSLDGPKAGETTKLVDLVLRQGDDEYTNPFKAGTLTLAGTKGGGELDRKSLTITGSTTVQDLTTFMTQSLGIHESIQRAKDSLIVDPGDVAMIDGQIQVTSNLGERNALDIGLTAFELTSGGTTETIALPFDLTQEGDGPGTTTSFFVYNSLGTPVDVSITTVREKLGVDGSTRYRWYANSADNQEQNNINNVTSVIGTGYIDFDSEGKIKPSTATSEVKVEFGGSAANSLVMKLDFSSVSSLDRENAQRVKISTLNMKSQDGFPPGVLTDFIITDSGSIQGQYTNGTQRTIGQVAMASFTNNEGLQQVGDSLFAEGVNSGKAVIGNPGEDGIGTLTAGATELSNTDIGQNLIKLVLASTQYRGGARVITAAQELLDELLAIRR